MPTEKFVIIPTEMIEDSRLTSTDIRVYAALKSFMDKDTKRCYPTRDKLGEKAKIGGRSITACTTRLSKSGYIKITPQFNSSNIYTLLK